MISVRDIHKSYSSAGKGRQGSEIEVLKGVSFDIYPSRVTTIVGPSGAGKSTLLNVLGTLERPDRGSVSYDGEDVFGLSDKNLSRFRNAHIGFVFQSHRLLPEFSIEENVAMSALIGGMGRHESMERARKLLEELGLGARLNHRPAELSGGECQRAAVARALVNNPGIVLADEPTGSLDSANRHELYEIFFGLRDSRRTTFVIVTHDDTLAAGSDRVIRLVDGKIVSDSANEAAEESAGADE